MALNVLRLGGAIQFRNLVARLSPAAGKPGVELCLLIRSDRKNGCEYDLVRTEQDVVLHPSRSSKANAAGGVEVSALYS